MFPSFAQGPLDFSDDNVLTERLSGGVVETFDECRPPNGIECSAGGIRKVSICSSNSLKKNGFDNREELSGKRNIGSGKDIDC